MSSSTTLVGNLTRDPELKFVGNQGVAVAKFAIAVNRRVKKGTEYEDKTSYFDVTAFGSLAENVANSLRKGVRVIVSGRVEQETWESEGQKRSKVVVQADSVGPDLRFANVSVSRGEGKAAVEEW